MKTRNIRWMMWLLMMAMVVSASAQKNVLKAFDKMENAKEVVVKKVSNKTNDLRMPGRWRCNVQEFHIPKAEVARKHIARIDEAFSKDSKKENVTYYTACMHWAKTLQTKRKRHTRRFWSGVMTLRRR